MPVLYIITGSNGAGKSSVGADYVPLRLRGSIFDGDKLLMDKWNEFANSGIKSHKEFKKLAIKSVKQTFDELIDSSLKNAADFAYEGHFTNDATWDVPKKFRDAGYEIHLIFFGLTDTTLSRTRVIGRVNEGGHYVDPVTIADNFYGNLEKLDKYFSLFDSVTILDTSGTDHVGLVVLKNGIPISAVQPAELPRWFTDNLPVISAKIIQL